MTLFWEPKWVRVKVKYEGIEVITCQDRTTKAYLCPLCTDISKVCPEGRETNVVSEDMVIFFTVEDLINHLRTHGLKLQDKKIIVKEVEEESR